MRYPLFITLLLWYAPYQYAQSNLTCGTDIVAQHLLANTAYANEQITYETAYRQVISSTTTRQKQSKVPYLFPVVIHILHDCSPVGTAHNPSDTKIKEVLIRTNERFSHSYPNAPTFENSLYGVDTDIAFCLASEDPNGKFTTGIVRYNDAEHARGNTSALSPYFSETLVWNTSKYLNIFLVADTDVAGVYLGGSERDYVIINSTFLWDGLLAHELGHYFSLKHIFSNENGRKKWRDLRVPRQLL